MAFGHRKRAKRPEQQLQIGVMKFLDLCLPADAIAFHVPNGGFRSHIEAKILKGMGTKPGIPDILIFWGGRVYCIELKADKEKLTDAQIAMHDRLVAAGCAITTARTLEAIETFLLDYGFPLKGKVQSHLRAPEKARAA